MFRSRSPRPADAAARRADTPGTAARAIATPTLARRSGVLAAVAAVAVLTGGPGADAQGTPAGGTASKADVLDMTFPIIDLDLPIESLDGSVSRTDSGSETRITLSADILFAFDRATLSGRAKSRLDDVREQLSSAKPGTVRIEGHTDDKGSPSYNLGLSERRAQAVRKALAGALGGATVTVVGRGEEDPVAANSVDGKDSPRGRARNRRVEIRLPTAG